MDDARRLVARGRRVPPRYRAADEHGVPGADERVEDARTPVDAVTLDQARLGVTTSNEATNDADSVRLARPTNSHRRRIKPKAYRTCIAKNTRDFCYITVELPEAYAEGLCVQTPIENNFFRTKIIAQNRIEHVKVIRNRVVVQYSTFDDS